MVIKHWVHQNFIFRPMVDSEKISAVNQKDVLLRVGMPLFLMKHCRPNIANVTGELLKVNNDVNLAAFVSCCK